MKKTIILTACLIFLVTFIFPVQETDHYSNSYARLSSVIGDVFIQRAADSDYEEGTVNLPLIEGDKLGAEEGRAEIHFGQKNYLRVDHYTQIDLSRLPRQGDDRIFIHLLSGSIFLRVSAMEREKDFAIHTPDASFYILTEGLYSLSVHKEGKTEFQVLEGAAEAAGEERSLLLEESERILVAEGTFLSEPETFYAADGNSFWDWNRSRDELIGPRTTASHLPVELEDYETELADNGRWVQERPYGYVWVPNVTVSDWRPYHRGRWVWYPVIGWTWVSSDPWGWCVTHYGRWHWRASLGWYWIPTRNWGPAWVHWYSGVDYIGWCPLSYYGYPGVLIGNHFYGRYYHRYYPAHSRALTVVHKTHLRSRHVSRVALAHGQISRVGRISLSARQPHAGSIRSGAPHVRAENALARSQLRRVTGGYPGRSSFGSRDRRGFPAEKNLTRNIPSTRIGTPGERHDAGSTTERGASIRSSSVSKSLPRFGSRIDADSGVRSSMTRSSTTIRVSRYSTRLGSYRSRLSGSSSLRSGNLRKTTPSIRSENRTRALEPRSYSRRRISSSMRTRPSFSSTSTPSSGSMRSRLSSGSGTEARRSTVRPSSESRSIRSSSYGAGIRSPSVKAGSSSESRRVSSRSISRSSRSSGSLIRSRSPMSSRSSGARRLSSRTSRRR